MTEWFKVADCKSVGVSHRRFESYFFQKLRNMTQSGSVPVLGTGSHVFKSHYFEINFLLINKKFEINKFFIKFFKIILNDDALLINLMLLIFFI